MTRQPAESCDDPTMPGLHFERLRLASPWFWMLYAVKREDGTPLGEVERIHNGTVWLATRHHDLEQRTFPTRRLAAHWLDTTGPQ